MEGERKKKKERKKKWNKRGLKTKKKVNVDQP